MPRAAKSNRATVSNRATIPVYQNLLLNSEDFTSASWSTTSGITLTANQAANPINATVTADKLEWTGAGYHMQTVSNLQPDQLYTFSVWVKGETKATTVIAVRGNTTNTPLYGFIVPLTTSWARYTFTISLPKGNNAALVGFENRAFAGGDELTGIMYAWGAQLNQGGDAGPYVVTTGSAVNTGSFRSMAVKQNHLIYSEDFSNSAWVKGANVSVTANQTANPVDGAVDADLIDVTSAGVNVGVYQLANTQGRGILQMVNTKSVWLKGVAGGEVVTLLDPQYSGNTTTCNLTTSWQRFTLTDSAHATRTQGGLWIRKSSGNQFYAWGAQLVFGSNLTDYVKTTASPVGILNSPRQSL